MECSPCRWLKEQRGSREVVLVVVSLALLVDNMLITVVVPIIPKFLYEKEHQNGNTSLVLMASSSASKASFASIYSLYGNVTNLSDQSNYQGINNKTQEAPQNSSCNMETSVLQHENIQVGLLFASKAIVQLLLNPIVGLITNRVGYDRPMFAGFIALFFSTLIFAFAESYWLMFFARSLQGVGSSLSSVAGMGMLAHVYPDDYERGKAMGIVLGGAELGVLTGPPFGSVMYEFVGKPSPFLVLAVLALLDGALQLCMLRFTKFVPGNIPPTSYLTLILDPYIVVTAVIVCLANMALGVLDPTLPIWIMKTMCPSNWQLGLAFLPSSVAYLLCTYLVGILSYKMGRWLCALVGLILMGVGLLLVPLPSNMYGLIGPVAATGIALGMIDTSIICIMGQLVDLRHTSVYGGIFAISGTAVGIGYALGPSCGGAITEAIGFPWSMTIFGLLCIIIAPFCLLLRNPPAREEKMAIVNKECPIETKTYMAQCKTSDLLFSYHSSDEDISTPNNRTMRIP